MFDVLPKVQAARGRVKKVVDLLVVDLQEGALAEELYQITILRERRREGEKEGERGGRERERERGGREGGRERERGGEMVMGYSLHIVT